jgi:hypothetical protein
MTIDVTQAVTEIAGGFAAVTVVGLAALMVYQLIGAFGYIKELIAERTVGTESEYDQKNGEAWERYYEQNQASWELEDPHDPRNNQDIPFK